MKMKMRATTSTCRMECRRTDPGEDVRSSRFSDGTLVWLQRKDTLIVKNPAVF